MLSMTRIYSRLAIIVRPADTADAAAISRIAETAQALHAKALPPSSSPQTVGRFPRATFTPLSRHLADTFGSPSRASARWAIFTPRCRTSQPPLLNWQRRSSMCIRWWWSSHLVAAVPELHCSGRRAGDLSSGSSMPSLGGFLPSVSRR